MLLGFLDIVSTKAVRGWHCSPNLVTQVDIYINNAYFQTAKCEEFRGDLEVIGLSVDGKAGFYISCTLVAFDKVSVFCHDSGVELNGSPQYLLSGRFESLQLLEGTSMIKELGLSLEQLPNCTSIYSKRGSVLAKPLPNSQGDIVGFVFKDLTLNKKWVELVKPKVSAEKIILAYEGFLKEVSIPHPVLLHQEKHINNVILAFEFIEGECLSGLARDRMTFRNPLRATIIKNIAKLSRYQYKKQNLDRLLGLWRNPFFRKYYLKIGSLVIGELKARRLSEAFFITKLFFSLSCSKSHFAHGDLHPANLIADNNQVWVFDWDHSGLYPMGYDLACFFRSEDIDLNRELYEQIIRDLIVSLNLNKTDKRVLERNFWALLYLMFSIDYKGSVNSKTLLLIKKEIVSRSLG